MEERGNQYIFKFDSSLISLNDVGLHEIEILLTDDSELKN